ncbi:hypothetical protein NUU61_001422 [Penicillium alfredii]|uniref:Uncharacterized protein n=1 Tax=Penicillium alfredii TaxID=1506179 RepID=A0A9W9G4E7_9EURO|nr:uncharacterized protein NUU61_001422 [Penicillium alfredii]KAJ5111792.1 hypothetical protein NUU61_001422 [Penicillium alfredii]
MSLKVPWNPGYGGSKLAPIIRRRWGAWSTEGRLNLSLRNCAVGFWVLAKPTPGTKAKLPGTTLRAPGSYNSSPQEICSPQEW